MTPNKTTLVVLSVCSILAGLMLSCSYGIAGSGTEGGNTEITGHILYENGSAAENTQVKLIPASYNPVVGQILPNSFIDTTDSLGAYKFTVSDTGTYTIQAIHLSQRTRLLINGVSTAKDTILLPPDTLREPGIIKVFLPDTVDTINGYIYIRGTTLYKNLTESATDSEGLVLVIDSVPAGKLPPVLYNTLNNQSVPVMIEDSLEVFSNDTTVIDPFVFWLHYTTENSDLTENKITDIFICSTEFPWLHDTTTIWVSTRSSGIAVFTKTEWILFNDSTSLIPSETVRQIVRYDNWSSLWIACDSGFANYSGGAWRVWTVNSGMQSNDVTCIALDSSGDIWAGMHNGIGFFNKSSEKWTSYDSITTGLYSHRVNDVAVDRDDNPWFATSTGVAWYHDSTWTVYTSSSGLVEDVVYCAAVDSKNAKWFGHSNGISRFDGAQWTTFNTAQSKILSGQVFTIVPDKDDNIWVGTKSGLTMFDGTQWNDMSDKYAFLANKAIRTICFENDGMMWLGTDNDGIIAFNPKIR